MAGAARGLMLAAFGYVCLGPNAAVEASVFTKFGGLTAMAIMPLIRCMMRQSASGSGFGSERTTTFTGLEDPVALSPRR